MKLLSRRTIGRSAAAVVVLGTALTPLTASASSSHLPTLLTGASSPFRVRPAVVDYGNGHSLLGGKSSDPTQSLGTFHWSSWGKKSASGSGISWQNNCNPDCGDGTYEPASATASASRVKGGHFTTLTIKTRGKTLTLHLSGSGSSSFWM